MLRSLPNMVGMLPTAVAFRSSANHENPGQGRALRSCIMLHPGTTLRQQIQSGRPISPFIGIYDAFSATIAAKNSSNLFYSGFGFAASHYGLPDIGYIAWTDIVQAAWRIRQILPNNGLLVDIDDGYVDSAVACHVTRQLETMGVAMIMLEDQARPRRCGHYDGKVILPLPQAHCSRHAAPGHKEYRSSPARA